MIGPRPPDGRGCGGRRALGAGGVRGRGPEFQYKQGARLVARGFPPRPARFCSPALGGICGRAANSREGDAGVHLQVGVPGQTILEGRSGAAGSEGLRCAPPGDRGAARRASPALALRAELPGAPRVEGKPGAGGLSPAQSAPPKPRTGESPCPAAGDAWGCPGSGPECQQVRGPAPCGPGRGEGGGVGFASLLSP